MRWTGPDFDVTSLLSCHIMGHFHYALGPQFLSLIANENDMVSLTYEHIGK